MQFITSLENPIDISQVMKPGKTYSLEIKEQRNTRSVQQNNYYWGVVVVVFGEEIGYLSKEHQTPGEYRIVSEWIHEEIFGELRVKKLRPFKDKRKKMSIKVSTKKMETKEFEEYMRDCRNYALAESNTYIPLPNECREIVRFQQYYY